MFGLCGHGNIGFLDALYARSEKIKTISVRHESIAGFMADVYYRVSGQPIATLTSCGPGSANLPIALANAFFDSVPFYAITGNVPTSQFNRGAFQETYRHYQADFPSTVRAYCKRVYQPTTAAQLPIAVRLAWKTMVTGRPGPVVLDVPFDMFNEPMTEDTPRPEDWNANISCRCGADPEGVSQGGRHAAPRGAAGDPRRTGRALRASDETIASARGAPAHSGGVLGERTRRDRFDAPALARTGRAQRHLPGESRCAPGRRAARARRALRRPHVELVDTGLLVHDPADAADPRRHRSRKRSAATIPVALGLMADVSTFLRQLLAELDARKARGEMPAERAPWLDAIAGYRKEWEDFIAPGFKLDTTPINPQRAAREIDQVMPEDGILVSDIGVHHNWLNQFCAPRRPDSLIGSMGFGPMGFGVGGALGAKLAAPDRPVVAVVGDGAFLMHANVLATAYEYQIPVVYVVWNNYAYASIRGLQRGYLDGRELATDFKRSRHAGALQPGFRRARAIGRDRRRERRQGSRSRRMRCGPASRRTSLASSTRTSAAT